MPKSSQNTINTITIKWGPKYKAHEVNALFKSIKKHSSLPLAFHCFTEDASGLDKHIQIHPLPKIPLSPGISKTYQKEAGLMNIDVLEGERVFFFDIDVAIVGSLDSLFNQPKNQEFWITRDWNHRFKKVGQASFFSYVVGSNRFVYDYFIANQESIKKQYGTACQEYLTDQMQHYNNLHFFPEKEIVSFKHHCLPAWPWRFFKTAQIPNQAKIVCFHGDPKIDHAAGGKWSTPKPPFLKRIYKTFKPVPWLAK